MSDKYDDAVEYLTAHPGEIYDSWVKPWTHDHGCLFAMASSQPYKINQPYGCLTQIRNGGTAATESLTKRIRSDERIPYRVSDEEYDIKEIVHALPVFAEWQRVIDKELNRVENID